MVRCVKLGLLFKLFNFPVIIIHELILCYSSVLGYDLFTLFNEKNSIPIFSADHFPDFSLSIC